MTYRPHILLSWGGQMGVSQETWSNSLRLVGNSDDPASLQGNAVDQIDDYVGHLRTLFSNAGTPYGAIAWVDWVKANAIDSNGRYYDQGETNAIYLTGNDRFQGIGNVMPFQVSMCITLRTEKQRGRAHSGRFYVPCAELNDIGADGLLPVGRCNAAASAVAEFITNINDNPGADTAAIRGAVVSGVGSPGPYQDITGVQVGRVLDTQRRRRRQLVEAYTSLSPVTGQG